MSRYEWERGTVILPSAAARALRAALTDTEAKRRERVEAEIDRLYAAKGSGGRTRETFNQTLEQWRSNRVDELLRTHGQVGYGGERYETPESRRRTYAVLAAYRFAYGRAAQGQFGRPAKRDIKALFPKRPKTGPTTFNMDPWGEATIHFDGSKVTYNSGHNNHAVKHARDTEMAEVFFAHLDKVEWTNGTGGTLTGNDEYNQDTDYAGGGANYITGAYGPLGDPYYMTAAQRQRVQESAAKFRTKPGNAGLCGARTMVNGRQTGPPCRNRFGSCPAHNPRRVPSHRGW